MPYDYNTAPYSGLATDISNNTGQFIAQTANMLEQRGEDAITRANAAMDTIAATDFSVGLTGLEGVSTPGLDASGVVLTDPAQILALNEGALAQLLQAAGEAPTLGAYVPSALQAIPADPNAVQPTVQDRTAPGVPTVATPLKPALAAVVFPDAPETTKPTVPALIDIQEAVAAIIASIPPFAAQEFLETAPSAAGLSADGLPALQFSEDAYSSALLSSTTAKIVELLNGLGLPDEVEQALWDRERAREDVTARRAVQEAVDAYAARGFSRPSGVLEARLAEIQEANQDKANAASRDIAIEQAKRLIENVRFAVQQAVALEGALLNAHIQKMQRALDAAKAGVELAISALNAKIAIFNAQVQAFLVSAQVFRIKIDGQLAELEQIKIRLDAQKLVGEINQQEVDLYDKQLKAVATDVDIFKAQVEAAIAKIQGNTQLVEQFKAEWSGVESAYGAYAKEMDGFVAQLQSDELRQKIYESVYRAWSQRAAAVGQVNEQTLKQDTLKMDAQRLVTETFAEKIKALSSVVQGNVAALQADAQRYGAEAGYQGEKAKLMQTWTQWLQSQAQWAGEFALKRADLSAQNARANLSLALEAQKSIATMNANMAASTNAAFGVNMGMRTSGDANANSSYQETHSYSY